MRRQDFLTDQRNKHLDGHFATCPVRDLKAGLKSNAALMPDQWSMQLVERATLVWNSDVKTKLQTWQHDKG